MAQVKAKCWWFLALGILIGLTALLGYGISLWINHSYLKDGPSSPPAMSESKSVLKSPVLEKALEQKAQEKALREQSGEKELWTLSNMLSEQGIEVVPGVFVDKRIGLAFLTELWLADKETKNIFRKYYKAGIYILLTDENYVSTGGTVCINANDSVKKAAQWLATGKE